MKMARAHLGTQAEVAPDEPVSRVAISRSASWGGAFGRTVAVLASFGVVVACNVYDETLLPIGPAAGGGGVTGNGGSSPGSGGAGAADVAGNGGSLGDGSTPVPDASQGGGGTGGAGGAVGSGGAAGIDSSVVSDVVSRDVTDGAVVDRVDVSTPPMCPLLIDDFEMTFGQINDGCRNGFWFTYNDGTVGGTQSPPSPFMPQTQSIPRPPGTKAGHTVGSGYTSAGMGVNFNAPPSGVRRVYNAGAYIGVTFWAVGVGNISVALPNRDTDPDGGVCGDGGRGGCFDHFLAPVVLSSTAWQQYTVLFSQLRQKGFGYQAPFFDKTAVFGIQWGVTMGGGFDFWIDDISFITSISDAAGQ